ncbi:MAG TPA: thiamine-phosphate kinase [Burkholderiaceae bacterium]|nr:thiamine-phosphate kinase [Burkholderiaceae bacterium]
MALTEFELIARYFTRAGHERQGIGDDCALIDVGDRTLAITTDSLIEHVHFFPGVDPASLGHKALAVNLSDLAAAGAQPRCFVLALSLPRAQAAWLEAFSRAMFELAAREGCELIGGDTTRAARIADQDGPVTICITAIGEVDRSLLRGRGGARAGDDLWVSGELGAAALAVAHAQGRVHLEPLQLSSCQQRLDWPQPRVGLGIALRGLASAAIDVSDGLLGDLGHLMERSGVGARVQVPEVPRSDALRAMDQPLQRRCVLAGGDDYELLFTASPGARDAVAAAGRKCCVAITRIGVMTKEAGLRLTGDPGIDAADATLSGFDHFAGTREA